MHSQVTSEATLEAEKRIVRQCLGSDEALEVTFIDSGWDSRIYSAEDGRVIFKFPRSEKVRMRYAWQVAALELAATVSSGVLIPAVRWVDSDFRYFGYGGIRGVSLRDLNVSLGEGRKRSIGTELGGFLARLHRLPPPEVRDMRPDKEIRQNQEWYQKSLEVSQP